MSHSSCSHAQVLTDVSRWAADQAKFQRATAIQRTAAETSHGQVKKVADRAPVDRDTFPGPLVLPNDDLAIDPKWPKQSFRSWLHEKDRNAVTPERKTVYVAEAPQISKRVDYIRGWTVPYTAGTSKIDPKQLAEPTLRYLAAYFHKLPVKRLPQKLEFVAWEDDEGKNSKTPARIGLKTETECIGITARGCSDNAFPRQLSVNDLIDGVISVLPDDAYALVMLVDHDIYESEDDDFLCGRAYGGSRAAVVSTARYHPCFDRGNDLDLQHMWPASHCLSYVNRELAAYGMQAMSSTSWGTKIDLTRESPLIAAIEAYRACDEKHSYGTKDIIGLWLSRVCRTASHELGHCFGMDHCVYYACNMQGTAGIPEDVRQPPYLCPVCQAKVLTATGGEANDRFQALLSFCVQWKHVPTFAAYAAWLRGVAR